MLLPILFNLDLLGADINSGSGFMKPIIAKDDVVGVGFDNQSIHTNNASSNNEQDFSDYSESDSVISISNSDRAAVYCINSLFKEEAQVITNDA